MEVVAGLVGAVAGATVAFALTEWQKRRHSKRKIIAALRSEFEVALELADEVTSLNRAFVAMAESNSPSYEWCEIAPFPTVAWDAAIAGGGVQELSEEAIRAAAKVSVAVLRANYVAGKIQAGRFDRQEAGRYNELIEELRQRLADALALMPAIR